MRTRSPLPWKLVAAFVKNMSILVTGAIPIDCVPGLGVTTAWLKQNGRQVSIRNNIKCVATCSIVNTDWMCG